MPEERQILTARQGSQVNSSHRLNIYSGQDAQTEDPETRNPEMLSRARERIQNKENMIAEKSGAEGEDEGGVYIKEPFTCRLSSCSSPRHNTVLACIYGLRICHAAISLTIIKEEHKFNEGTKLLCCGCTSMPSLRTTNPLQLDSFLFLGQILERTRARARPPPRQPVIHVSSQEIPEIPLQEMESAMANSTSVLEVTETGITNRGQETETTTANPTLILEIAQSQTTIQVPEDSTLLNSAQLPEQETNGLTPDLQTEEQNYAPERALSHHGNIIRDSSLTTDLGLGFYHDYHTEEARDVSMLANQKHGRAFETILLSEHSGRDRGGSRPQPQKKSSLKPLMKMR